MTLYTDNLQRKERLVLKYMIPGQGISSKALVTRMLQQGEDKATIGNITPILSRLADNGYISTEPKKGSPGFNWTKNETRTLGRKGPKYARRKKPNGANGELPVNKEASQLNGNVNHGALLKEVVNHLETIIVSAERIREKLESIEPALNLIDQIRSK